MGRLASVLAVGLILVSCSALRATPAPSSYGNGASSEAQTTAATTPSSDSPGPTTEYTLTPSYSSLRGTGSTPPLLAPNVEPVQLPPDGVQTFSLASVDDGSQPVRYLYQDADLFFFSIGRTVYGYQFAKQHPTPDVMATAEAGQQVLGIDGGTGDWVWATGNYASTSGNGALQGSGCAQLRLVPSNPVAELNAQFVNSRIRSCAAAPPMFAMDGSEIAVAVEAPRENHPQAWEIRVMRFFDGTLLRTIETDGDGFSLDLSGDAVAYVDGEINAESSPNAAINTRLMLSTADSLNAVEVAQDAYDISFSDGRLAWRNDPQTSQGNESANSPSLMTMSVIDHTPPRVVSTEISTSSSDPVAANSWVTWTEGGHLFLWNAESNVSWRIDGTGEALNASDRGGWLTWVTQDGNGVPSLNAIELTTLFRPVPTPTPTPSPAATPIPSQPVASPRVVEVDGVAWSVLEKAALPNLDGFYDVESPDNHLVADIGVGDDPAAGSDKRVRQTAEYRSRVMTGSLGRSWERS